MSHTEKITGVINTPGAIFTCSGDRTVKVLEPTKEPEVIATLSVHNKEIAKVFFLICHKMITCIMKLFTTFLNLVWSGL